MVEFLFILFVFMFKFMLLLLFLVKCLFLKKRFVLFLVLFLKFKCLGLVWVKDKILLDWFLKIFVFFFVKMFLKFKFFGL